MNGHLVLSVVNGLLVFLVLLDLVYYSYFYALVEPLVIRIPLAGKAQLDLIQIY